jgi:hypothetical protein
LFLVGIHEEFGQNCRLVGLATASGNRYAGEVQLWDTATLGKKR